VLPASHARRVLLVFCGVGGASVAPAARAAEAVEASAPPTKLQKSDLPEVDVLTFHRANYFISGFNKTTQAKFQFSAKYDLWPSAGHHTVYLAYTQKSLWDIYDSSAPFRESDYAPELFYAHYHADDREQAPPSCGLFSEQLGVEHESNGERTASSRSWNRVSADARLSCGGHPWYGYLDLRVWYPFLLHENAGIVHTQGYGELAVSGGVDAPDLHMNGVVSIALRKGTARSLRKGSLTLDARWRPTYQNLLGTAWRFAPFVWFQLFTGYGETLGTFDQATTSARLGLGLTDRAR
jgi:phospholipase A1/A2